LSLAAANAARDAEIYQVPKHTKVKSKSDQPKAGNLKRRNVHRESEILRSSFNQIINFKDNEGRPLGEYKARPQCLTGVPMELRECKYLGSRYQHSYPMNISALKQMLNCWPEVIGGLDFLRKLYLEYESRQEISLFDLWRLSRLGGDLPGYLLLREHNPLGDNELPAFVAALFKVVIGITTTIRSQFIENIPDEGYSIHAPAQPTLLFEYAESRDLLIGKEQVCAGPQRLIMETLQFLTYGQADTAPNPKQIKSLLPDSKRFFDYSSHLMDCHLISLLFDAINSCLVHDVACLLEKGSETMGALQSFRAGLLSALDEPKLASENVLFKAVSILGHEERARLGPLLGLLTDAKAGPPQNCLRAIAQSMASVWQRSHALQVDQMMHLLSKSNGRMKSPKLRELQPIVKPLVIYLEVEWWWLEALKMVEAGLKRSLGRTASPARIKSFDSLLTDSPVRSFFQRALGIKIQHQGQGTIVRLGKAVLRFERESPPRAVREFVPV
jgi:hypothetical protein